MSQASRGAPNALPAASDRPQGVRRGIGNRAMTGRWAMEIEILGPLRVRVDGCEVALGGWRSRTLLAALALEAGRVVVVDRLIDVVWRDAPPPSARAQVANSVSTLRRAIGRAGGDPAAIETVHGGYRLCADTARLDARTAHRLVRRARTAADDAHAVTLYRAALGLWRGSVLAGLTGPAMDAARLRWEETRLLAVEELAEAELRLGRHHELAGDLMAVVAEHPYRERPRAQLMVALCRAGRRAEALEVYRDGRRVLVGELGLEPGRDLSALHDAILRGDPVGGAGEEAPVHR